MKTYPYQYLCDGTANGFYGLGTMWDGYNPKTKQCEFVSFVIARGESECVQEAVLYGDYPEPAIYEPVENEMIIVRPKLIYPKRG